MIIFGGSWLLLGGVVIVCSWCFFHFFCVLLVSCAAFASIFLLAFIGSIDVGCLFMLWSCLTSFAGHWYFMLTGRKPALLTRPVFLQVAMMQERSSSYLRAASLGTWPKAASSIGPHPVAWWEKLIFFLPGKKAGHVLLYGVSEVVLLFFVAWKSWKCFVVSVVSCIAVCSLVVLWLLWISWCGFSWWWSLVVYCDTVWHIFYIFLICGEGWKIQVFRDKAKNNDQWLTWCGLRLSFCHFTSNKFHKMLFTAQCAIQYNLCFVQYFQRSMLYEDLQCVQWLSLFFLPLLWSRYPGNLMVSLVHRLFFHGAHPSQWGSEMIVGVLKDPLKDIGSVEAKKKRHHKGQNIFNTAGTLNASMEWKMNMWGSIKRSL